MKKFKIIILIFLFTMVSCQNSDEYSNYIFENTSFNCIFFLNNLIPCRSKRPFYFSRKGFIARDFHDNVYFCIINNVKKNINNGADPNYCIGEEGWISENPLNILINRLYDTYKIKFQKYNNKKQDSSITIPDVAVLNILIDNGADINKRPLIWCRVFNFNNKDISDLESDLARLKSDGYNAANLSDATKYFIKDSNRLIKALLKKGADPDMKGHPYPYILDPFKLMTDKTANKYFAKGTRPINEAIKKGIVWESQVDLLMKYGARLDEKSLEAAKESGDPKMIEKIDKLWQIQNKNKI